MEAMIMNILDTFVITSFSKTENKGKYRILPLMSIVIFNKPAALFNQSYKSPSGTEE